MRLVDRDVVRQFVDSADPDAALVFTRGSCVVLPAVAAVREGAGLLVVRRRDFAAYLPAGAVTEERLDVLTGCLDNAVRDLGG